MEIPRISVSASAFAIMAFASPLWVTCFTTCSQSHVSMLLDSSSWLCPLGKWEFWPLDPQWGMQVNRNDTIELRIEENRAIGCQKKGLSSTPNQKPNGQPETSHIMPSCYYLKLWTGTIFWTCQSCDTPRILLMIVSYLSSATKK